MTGLPASESREITEHRPRDFQTNLDASCNVQPEKTSKFTETDHSLASSLAKFVRRSTRKSTRNSMQNRSRERLGAPKIDSEPVPGASRDAPWQPRASRWRLGSVSGASWGVLGAPWERPETLQGRPGTPERAPGSVRERPEATKIDAKSRPGAKKSICFRAVRSRSVVGAIFRRFSSIFGFFVKSANPPKYCACQQKQRFGPSRRESSRSRDVTSKNLENRPENRSEIVENCLSECLGRPLGSPEAPEKPDFPANPEFPRHADAGMADP